MASNRSKTMPKIFVNDLNVQRFSGIFSAHLCWPEDCQQKNWSDIMSGSPECFATKLWPKIVDKLPLITGDQQSVQRINELMFGLILKELDLLSLSQMQYFEAVLDIFNDEITIGLKCWLKICYQFNWRLIYAKQVVSHRNRNSKDLIQSIVDEIEANERNNCFTAEEISYFYSLIDCICVQLLANNVVKMSSKGNQFLTDIQSKSCSNLSQLNYHPFLRQLSTFNVLTQELIGFTLDLIQSDCLCDDIIENQLRQLEALFISGSQEMIEFPDDISKTMAEDIAVAKDNQKCLQLVNKQYFLLNKSKLSLQSLEDFFVLIDSKTVDLLPSKQFHYLSDILDDKQNPNFRQLIEILISFADFETFGVLLSSINAFDVNNNDLTLNLAKRIVQTSADPKTKSFLIVLLTKSLHFCESIDLKSRLNDLKINKICEPKMDCIRTLFNQITRDDLESNLFKELTHELLIGIYLNPFPVYNLVLDLALHHNRAQTGLVAKLISDQLYSLSRFQFNGPQSETFLLKFIVHLLMERPSIQLVDDITRLIEKIVDCPLSDDREPVLKLEEMFFYLISLKNQMKSDVVWLKLRLIKNIIDMSGDQLWPTIDSTPVPTILFLLQFLEYFWQTPNRKQLVIEILDQILDKKLTRNLTEEELTHLDELLAKRFIYTAGKATTYKIYLAYCEKRFPKPTSEVIDIEHNICHDQILCYATITLDFMWICRIYPEYQLFEEQTKIALNYILPSLTAEEFHKLFKFLQMYYYNKNVVTQLRTAIFAIGRSIDKKPLIKCLMDVVVNEILIPMRNETIDRPLSQQDFEFIHNELGVLFKSMATLDYHMLPKDLTIRLEEILTELAERMAFESINGYELYDKPNKIPVTAREVLKKVYGYDFPLKYEDPEPVPPIIRPAGMQEQRPALNYIPETVCQ